MEEVGVSSMMCLPVKYASVRQPQLAVDVGLLSNLRTISSFHDHPQPFNLAIRERSSRAAASSAHGGLPIAE
jgi:hypothetical protein